MIPAKHNARTGQAERLRDRLVRVAALRVMPAMAVVAMGLLLAPDAVANCCTPKSGGSPNANSIHTLYVIVLIVAAIVFIAVEGALFVAVFRFRAKRHPVAHQTHGNTRLEIGWTAGAAVILLILTVVTFIKLPSIINAPNSDANGLNLTASLSEPSPPNGKKLNICVQARQYIWRYTYSSATQNCKNDSFSTAGGKTTILPYSFTTMVVPVHTTVVLTIQSSDVIHSWWIPSLGGKVDAVPGYTVYTWFKATHTGFFHGQCAQLCGTNHAAMVAYVRVVSPQKYQTWLGKQESEITAQNNQVQQLRQTLSSENQLGN